MCNAVGHIYNIFHKQIFPELADIVANESHLSRRKYKYSAKKRTTVHASRAP